MECINCKDKINVNDKYCRNCGIRIRKNSYYIIINIFMIILFLLMLFLIGLIVVSFIVD